MFTFLVHFANIKRYLHTLEVHPETYWVETRLCRIFRRGKEPGRTGPHWPVVGIVEFH